ncbi:hypothetical protein DFP73DRAFT_530350 [Morchella snyderi]|nr:hypothetical protein DFP73DRAFT_530350 [Morchella snyderi]
MLLRREQGALKTIFCKTIYYQWATSQPRRAAVSLLGAGPRPGIRRAALVPSEQSSVGEFFWFTFSFLLAYLPAASYTLPLETMSPTSYNHLQCTCCNSFCTRLQCTSCCTRLMITVVSPPPPPVPAKPAAERAKSFTPANADSANADSNRADTSDRQDRTR